MTPRIQTLITEFVENLTSAIQAEGAAAFAVAIGGENRRPSAKVSRALPTLQPTAKPKPRPKGSKRSPEELETLTKSLLSAIRKEPGRRIEEIGKTLGVATKDLALPVSKLFDMKAIKTSGQRRATKYFPK